jgi:hypothetical protein
VATEIKVVEAKKVTHKRCLGAALSYQFMMHIRFLATELIVDNSTAQGDY